mmetsp:Transcript_56157/g.100006  ORF Transcript_56157/g.100006 Transcript_56157/m.100006 type:complete len:923 (-) Transcript_56157:138-2906(-)
MDPKQADEVIVDDLPSDFSQSILLETVNEFISVNYSYDAHKDEKKRPKGRAIVGRGVNGKPSADEWCTPFTAQRQACGNAIKEYTVSVAEGFFVGEPYGTVKRTGYGPPMRNAPLSLPSAVSPRFGFSSGWLTSRPTVQEAKRRRQLAPSKARFPALQSAKSGHAEESVMEELDDFDREHAWTANKVQDRREIREADYTNISPWVRGTPKPRLLERKEGQLNDPDLLKELGPAPPSPSLSGHWKIESSSAPVVPGKGATPEIVKTSAPPSPVENHSSPRDVPRSKKSGSIADIALVAGALPSVATGSAGILKKASVTGRLANFHQMLNKNMTEMPDALQNAILEARDAKSGFPSSSPRQSVLSRAGEDKPPQSGRRESGIWRLGHKESKSDRMHRVNHYRRMDREETGGGVNFRDRVSKSDREIAQEAWSRYFESETSNHWDQEEVVEALSDFGIKAANKTEKNALYGILQEYEDLEGPTFGLKHFFSIIEEARQKLRSTRTVSVFQAWKYVDTEDVGALSPSDVMKLLEDLHLANPENTVEWGGIQAMIRDCNTDPVTELIAFSEVEFLISTVREDRTRSRRLQERRLEAEYHIIPSLFSEFRSQLISFHTCFCDLDEDASGYLDNEEAMNLLSHFGCLSNSMPVERKEKIQDLLNSYSVLSENGRWETRLTFVQFLTIVRTIRELEMEDKRDAVNTLFSTYDRDNSGDLCIKEVCCVLDDMGIHPHSLPEQEAMAMLIEESDADGSGELNVSELLFLVQRITERVQEMTAEEHNKRGQELRFSLKETNKLRQAFEALDVQGDGSLGVTEVERAIAMAGSNVPHHKAVKIIEEIDDDDSGQLDFCEFLTLMRKIEDEILLTQGHRNQSQSSDLPRQVTIGLDEKEDKDGPAEARRGTVANSKRGGGRRAVGGPAGGAGKKR